MEDINRNENLGDQSMENDESPKAAAGNDLDLDFILDIPFELSVEIGSGPDDRK